MPVTWRNSRRVLLGTACMGCSCGGEISAFDHTGATLVAVGFTRQDRKPVS
jgi:hypothetical protein